jgi:hypothetical protein
MWNDNPATSACGATMDMNTAKMQAAYANQKPQNPSVTRSADTTLESAANLRAFAGSMRDELLQMGNSIDGLAPGRPCRMGIGGKLEDATDYIGESLKMLQEMRAYLLG